MAFQNNTIESFMNDLSSKAPVPGGGGASALVGALSGALTHMVASLTVGKPKYAAVEAEMNDLLAQSDAITKRFLSLMDEDAIAFEPLAQAYRLPKDTEEQKLEKERVMEEALKSAVLPPLRIMEICADAVSLIALCAEKGSVVAVSDAGVAASLCRAALEGASLNVLINTRTMRDRVYAEELNNKARQLLEQVSTAADLIYQQVSKRLGA